MTHDSWQSPRRSAALRRQPAGAACSRRRCGPGAPPTCTVNPTSATPSSAGTSFAVTVSSNISQRYIFDIVGVGNDSAAITHSAAVTFITTPSQNFDFTMGITPASASVPAGQPVIFSLDVNPTNGSFPSNVSFACSKLPALTTCGFNPPQVGSGSEDSAVTFTVGTTNVRKFFRLMRSRFSNSMDSAERPRRGRRAPKRDLRIDLSAAGVNNGTARPFIRT